ncbi:hypothetical protein ABK040_010591 [Willaertia magna]
MYLVEVGKQTLILLKKNGLLYLRRWKSTLFQLLSPVIIFLILFGLQKISESFKGKNELHPSVAPIHKGIDFPLDNAKNSNFNGTYKIPKFYSCTPWDEKTCFKLGFSSNGVAFGETVMSQLLVEDYKLEEGKDYINFTTKNQLEEWMYKNQNRTLIGVAFDVGTSVYDTSYTLYYNRTKSDLVTPVSSVQNLIDNTIIYLRMKQLGRKIDRNSISVDYKPFPSPPQTQNGQVFLSQSTGPTFFSIGAMIVLIVSLSSVVMEKEYRLRYSMIMMGMKDSAYFLSWFITFFIICIIFSFINGVVNMIYEKMPAIGILLMFYPPFNFAKVFYDISEKALPQYDAAKRSYVTGPGFGFTDLGNSLMFLILYWYCDKVFSDASGVRKSPIFFLQPSYWGINIFKRKKKSFEEDNDEEELKMIETEDVKQEFHKARDQNIKAAVRIISLKKTFIGFFAGLFKVLFPKNKLFREKQALKGLSLVVEEGTCVALLGHNGAGKTTTMSILSGLYSQTKGDAYIDGLDVKSNIGKIRKQLGMCPQHDILWDDLTAEEHLQLFGNLKGISKKQRQEEVKSLLEAVDLLHVGHHLVKTFSGGMKRRLSLCISCVGNPKLIMLDEPTTGLDPHSRKKSWNLIQKMKVGRAMILTTHHLDEADYLADRIAIMANGELKCIGSSLEIKAQYGKGYNLHVIANSGFENQVQQTVVKNIEGVELVSKDAGNFIFNVPKEQTVALGHFLFNLEQDTLMFKDWGIAQTTLEEVYLKVTKESDFTYKEFKTASSSDVEMKEISVMENQNTIRL